jgi:hypothetical protein
MVKLHNTHSKTSLDLIQMSIRDTKTLWVVREKDAGVLGRLGHNASNAHWSMFGILHI